MATDIEQRLSDGLAQLGVTANPHLTGTLVQYLELLQKWNRAYNLTSIAELDDMAVRHILDSISARPFLQGSAVLDAGSGAGLPGVPLALIEPARHFTLLDSVGKKVRFLRQVVTDLKLANATPVQARLEQWQPDALFDTVISRAFGSLAEFALVCGRLVAPAGRLVAMKGRRPVAEMNAVAMPWRVSAVERIAVPGLDGERHIVVMDR